MGAVCNSTGGFDVTFGQTIRRLRRERRLTQRELAQQIQARGLRADFTYISKIENDRLGIPPSESLIRALAEVLGADADELLDLAGKFNQRALQEVVSEIPEAGVLLRRLQARKFTRQQIRKFLDETE